MVGHVFLRRACIATHGPLLIPLCSGCCLPLETDCLPKNRKILKKQNSTLKLLADFGPRPIQVIPRRVPAPSDLIYDIRQLLIARQTIWRPGSTTCRGKSRVPPFRRAAASFWSFHEWRLESAFVDSKAPDF